MVASELLLVLSIGSCAVCSASQTTASTFVIPVAFNFRHFLQFVRFFPFFLSFYCCLTAAGSMYRNLIPISLLL